MPSDSVPSSIPRVSLPVTFPISPLIRLTLLVLYAALTLPLPLLAQASAAPVSPRWLWLGVGMGAIALWGALGERVVVSDQGLCSEYPLWIRWVFRRNWSLEWSEIRRLVPRSTGQGGLVYYLVNATGQGYLLPMRMAGFARFVQVLEEKTGIDTRDVKPLAQPWMYLTLLGFSGVLLLIDGWLLSQGFGQGM